MANFVPDKEPVTTPSTPTDKLTDLTNTTWYFNEILTSDIVDTNLNIIFISKSQNYDSFYFELVEPEEGSTVDGLSMFYEIPNGRSETAYDDGNPTKWIDQAYRTIKITGGTDATNTTLIDWLYANATLQESAEPVEPTPTTSLNLSISYNGTEVTTESGNEIAISYNGAVIKTITSAGTTILQCAGKMMKSDVTIGTKTLNCNGKYMRDNITIVATITDSSPKAKIYGVSEVGSQDGSCVRIDDAVGLDFVINSSSGIIDSDFDTEEIYSEIKCVTDTNGNVMIGIPKLYVEVTQDETTFKKTFRISKQPFGNAIVHPAFKDMKGNYKDWVYIGKYTNVVENGKVYSKSDGMTGNISYTDAVSQCLAQGDDYFMMDYWILSLLQILFTIEFATTNSQSIMQGNVNGSGQRPTYTGTTNRLGVVATGCGAYNCMVYRGIENLWGNALQWINGITFKSKNIYVCYDRANYVTNSTLNPYVLVGYNLNPNGGGNSIKHGFDKDNPLVDFSIEVNGKDYDNGGYWYDYSGDGNYSANLLDIGGCCVNGSMSGLWLVDRSGGDKSYITCARLAYI